MGTWSLFAVDNDGWRASLRNGRDDRDEHDAERSDVTNVAAVVIVCRVVITVALDRSLVTR